MNFYSPVSNTRCHSIWHIMRITKIKILVDSQGQGIFSVQLMLFWVVVKVKCAVVTDVLCSCKKNSNYKGEKLKVVQLSNTKTTVNLAGQQ